MPTTKFDDWKDGPPRPTGIPGGKGRRHFRLAVLGLFLLLNITWVHLSAEAAGLSLQSTPGGIALTPSGANYRSSFGNLNSLGIGPPSQAGVTIIPLGNGALYYSTYQLTVSGTGQAGNQMYVNANVSSNFVHPAALQVQSCPSTSACNTSGAYSAMSLNAGAQTSVVPLAPGITDGETVTAGLAIFVPDNNGAAAFSGSDTATISFTLYDSDNNNAVVNTVTLALDLPQQALQTSVQLNLATAPAGRTVTAASDFSMNFGNVNALGIGPGAGLTTVPSTGGIIYSTPYNLRPAFSGFGSANATIKVYVGMDFVHPAILQIDDSATAGGPYTAISNDAGAQTQITNSAANRSSITRYLGLFVSNINGVPAYVGADNATLTFTLTVP